VKVLIVGGGGREHALAWKAAQSPQVSKVYVAPGNAGTAREPGVENLPIGAQDIPALKAFAERHDIGLTIVGPEAPLVAGIVDALRDAGLAAFGPSRAAARLEGSKAYAKDFLARYHIPTAAYASFTEPDAAIAYIRRQGAPLVVKADGLAAGKGVVLTDDEPQAIAAARDMLGAGAFGEAGRRIVIEERLQGEEASFICMVDGEHILALATSQDHKARDEGDTGPNTGGMGAYSPAPVITPAVHRRILDEVIGPTVSALAAEGQPYTGFLYAGLMIDPQGNPRVLEYNCRFGDPETQPILMRLRSDLVALCQAALQGRLDTVNADWDPRAALGVVMAAGGYPGSYRKGDVIRGLDERRGDDLKVFHAGTASRDGEIVTDGGRVLCVTALGHSVAEAQERAYEAIARIHWEGVYYRRDIGYRALVSEGTGGT